MSARVKLCARRFGLLCFPLSAALWAPSTAQAAASFSLSPREASGEQPEEGKEDSEEKGEQAVPYNPYEEGQPKEGSEADNGEKKEGPQQDGSEANKAEEKEQPGQDAAAPQGEGDSQDKSAEGGDEAEIQYDQAPPAEGQNDGNETGGDQAAGDEGAQDDGGVEMEFGEQPSEGEGGQEQAGGEEGEQAGTGEEGASEEGSVEMQFGDEPSPETDSGSAPEEDEDEGGFVFEDISDDKEALAEELQAGQRQAKGVVGTVRGKITGSDGQEVMGAYVETQDKKYVARAGVDGTFELNLNPGVYTLRVRYDGYEERLFENIEVKAREGVTLDAQITPLPGAVQTMVIEEEVAKEGNLGQSIRRQKSRASRDIISQEEMGKSGGGSSSSVARRIVGSTVVGGKYIFVRGLGHRYGNTLLDGARVPSPDPDLRTVPLDIFPTSALSAINVQKTFTPDVPGDFTGGSVQLETRDIPERFTFKIGLSGGLNTVTSFRQRLSTKGVPGADGFAFGNIKRGMTDSVRKAPRQIARPTKNLKTGVYEPYTPQQVEQFGESLFTHTLVKNNTHAPMNFGAKLSVGNSWDVFNRGKLGFLAAGGYSNKMSIRRGILKFYQLTGDPEGEQKLQPDSPLRDFKTFNTAHEVAFNGMGILKLIADDYNRVALTGMYSRDASDSIQRNEGTNQSNPGGRFVNDRIRYTMRSVAFSRLGGKHELPRANHIKVDWFGSYALAKRDDPAMRDILYLDLRDKPESILQLDAGSRAIFSNYLDLTDHTETGALNISIPFKQWLQLDSLVKVGGWAEGKQRTFFVRSFLSKARSAKLGESNALNGAAVDILTPATLGGGTNDFAPEAIYFLTENTQDVDNYDGEQVQFAGYGLVDLPITRKLKISAGARFEYNLIKTLPTSPFERTPEEIAELEKLGTRLRDHDVLPSVNLSFDFSEKMKIRASGSKTVARPELRELTSFVFTDFLSGIDITGHPDLKSTRVWNGDLRWEWFPEPGDVLAATLFYKHFDKPIESVMSSRPDQGLSSFRNAKSARNFGFELEGRKNLGFVSTWLKPVTLGANFAFVNSRVTLNPKLQCDALPDGPEKDKCKYDRTFDASTSRERPLQGQSPFVLNSFVDFNWKTTGTSLRLLYNTFGRRIFQIGGGGIPDMYEEGVHSVDLTFGQILHKTPELIDDEGNIKSPSKALKLGFGIQNLANSPIRYGYEQDGAFIASRRYKKGVTISLGLDWGF